MQHDQQRQPLAELYAGRAVQPKVASSRGDDGCSKRNRKDHRRLEFIPGFPRRIMPSAPADRRSPRTRGNLRIGDQWNAITIIALSQSNPLKAIAELVENSIDARAREIVITRGKEKGQHYLRVADDGEGVRKDGEGQPDFHHVATHICDSIKRQLKAEGATGMQGEFGIGLLSFWTLGEELTLSSTGIDGKIWQMHLKKGDPSYRITHRAALFAQAGSEVLIRGVLPGVRNFSGEKIQWYLASELRDRIRHSGVSIRVVDRTARAEFKVEPRQFEGRLLHELTGAMPADSDLYCEIYLHTPSEANAVSLYRSGTRVLGSLTEVAAFARMPWNSGYLQGIVDAPYLNLTPGTRLGVIHDDELERLARELAPIEARLTRTVEDQQRAEENRATRDVLKSVQGALKEALLALPADEYAWFDLHRADARRPQRAADAADPEVDPSEVRTVDDALAAIASTTAEAIEDDDAPQFFTYAGPLFSVLISPTSSVVEVNGSRALRAIARDRSRRTVDSNLAFAWAIVEGEGVLDDISGEIATFRASSEPGLTRLRLTATQGEIVRAADAQVTIAATLMPKTSAGEGRYPGLPGYTYQKAAGELWRSRFDAERNLVVINSGHRDFVYAARNRMLKLRYICRLFAKELVLKNFGGIPPDQLLERLLELTLYTEENLR